MIQNLIEIENDLSQVSGSVGLHNFVVGHASQHVRMVRAELCLARLHDLHLELLGLIPQALIPVYRRDIGYARQRVWMIRA
ncbi:hypothetical protein N7478_000816 [Penicillium angulare]|uniref:uncharacterized protein n=1 Tax=Penicillium angulare TaxID=116970 RepID=UPI0025423242|nr:uncharacterized protein N7478_000816 [Penicillium angulare]KAJ5291565.1 hypothetical protein N7478_000816 [Penicillium angulare]